MIFRAWQLSFVTIVIFITVGITSAQDFDECIPYKEVAWQNISRDAASVSDPNGRPLGYVQAVLPYAGNNPNAKNPCYTLKLTDSKKQTIQIMATGVSGFPPICVKSNRRGAQPNCQSSLTSCTDNPIGGSNEIKYVFYCSGCEADVSIWLRFNVSHLITEGLEFETWCSDTNSQYPGSLLRIPPETNGGDKKPTNSTATVMSGTTLLVLLFILTFI